MSGRNLRELDAIALRYETPAASLARALGAIGVARLLLVRRRDRYPRPDAYVVRVEEALDQARDAGREWQRAYAAEVGYPEQWRRGEGTRLGSGVSTAAQCGGERCCGDLVA